METPKFHTIVHKRGKRFSEEHIPPWTPDTMIPTADCPQFPPHLRRTPPPMPLPDLSPQECDAALKWIMNEDPLAGPVPQTVYGRHVAVQTYNRLVEAHLRKQRS